MPRASYQQRKPTAIPSKTPEYRCWQSMKQRCYNKANARYRYYGGRGILVCEGFHHFPTFVRIVGLKPKPSLSIERNDVNGHYSCGQCNECLGKGWPSNCRWATLIEQANNTRRNHYLTFQGEMLTLAQLARKLKVKYQRLEAGLRAGIALETIMTEEKERMRLVRLKARLRRDW